MSERWKVAKIADLGKKHRPVLKAGPFGSSITKSLYIDSGYKVYGQQEVVSGNAHSGNYFIDEELFDAHRSCAVEPGDILITMMGTIGRVLLIPDDAAPGVINPRLIRIALDNQVIFPSFARYVLESLPIQRLLEHRSQGGTMPGLNAQALASIRIPIPPLSEQRKIAEILRTWDEALEKLEALLTAKMRRFTWFRTHLFTGKKRLPGFAGKWSETLLLEVLTEHGLQSTGGEEVFSVSVHKGLVNQIEHLGRSFAATETGHYNRVRPGDIVYTKSPTGDFPLGIIKQSKINKEVIVSPLYGVFTPVTRALGVILDAYFASPMTVRNYLHPLVQKGAKNTIAITNKRFLEGKLLLPLEPREQQAIAQIIETAQSELVGIEAEIEALTFQKRGLMQKLLTGEWRVKVSSEKEAAA